MIFSQFAKIGRAQAITAIGLARNHTEYNENKCKSCPHYAQAVIRASIKGCSVLDVLKSERKCTSCRKYISYDNEKNKYGDERERLNTGAIQLYFALHLLEPDSYGVILHFSVKEAAALLHCDRKTILSNLKILKEKKYIAVTNSDERGRYIIAILEYENNFKPAKNGGRGFFTISKDWFNDVLLSCNNINQLRIDLRQYITCDLLGEKAYNMIETSIKQLHFGLPKYLRPGKIKELALVNRPLFTVTFHEQSFFFKINNKYFSRMVKKECHADADIQLNSFIELINDWLKQRRESGFVSIHNIPQNIVPVYIYRTTHCKCEDLFFNNQDYSDLIQMAVQYGYDILEKALISVLSFDPPSSIPAKVRTTIISSLQAA